MVSSIANSLGFGSGLDIKQLVTDLSNASREPKIARIATMTQQNQARISAVAQAKSDLEGFADSLSQMIADGALRSSPTVSDDSMLGLSARAGLQADSFAATVTVSQLARAQTAYSGVVADRTAAIGQGTMTLSVGGTVLILRPISRSVSRLTPDWPRRCSSKLSATLRPAQAPSSQSALFGL